MPRFDDDVISRSKALKSFAKLNIDLNCSGETSIDGFVRLMASEYDENGATINDAGDIECK